MTDFLTVDPAYVPMPYSDRPFGGGVQGENALRQSVCRANAIAEVCREQLHQAITVAHICRRDNNHHEQTEGIHQDVPFAPFDSLASVKTP